MSACPECAYFRSKVTMTRRLGGGWVRRWRRCEQEGCGTKWTTYEIPCNAVDVEEHSPEFLKELVRGETDG